MPVNNSCKKLTRRFLSKTKSNGHMRYKEPRSGDWSELNVRQPGVVIDRPSVALRDPLVVEFVSRFWASGSCEAISLIDSFNDFLRDCESVDSARDCLKLAGELAQSESVRQQMEERGVAYSVSVLSYAFNGEIFGECCTFLSGLLRVYDERMFRDYVRFTGRCDAEGVRSTAPMIWVIAKSACSVDDCVYRRFIKPLERLVDCGELCYSMLCCETLSRFSTSFCRSMALSRVTQMVARNLGQIEKRELAMLFLARVYRANPFATNLAKDLEYNVVLRAVSKNLDPGCVCAAVKLLSAAASLKSIPAKLVRRITEHLSILSILESTPFELRRACILAFCQFARAAMCEPIHTEWYDVVASTWWADDLELTRETLQFLLGLPRLQMSDMDAVQHLEVCGSEDIEAMAKQLCARQRECLNPFY